MNAIFPDLLFLGPYFAPTLLRAGLALYFLLHARALWALEGKRAKLLAGKEAVFGLFITAGFLTQLVALFGVLVVLFRGMWLKTDAPTTPLHEKVLASAALLALVLTGAGAFAIDLPY